MPGGCQVSLVSHHVALGRRPRFGISEFARIWMSSKVDLALYLLYGYTRLFDYECIRLAERHWANNYWARQI